MESLNEIQNRFIEEANAILSQIEFVEESIILPTLRNNGNNHIREIFPSIQTITDAQIKLNDIITSLNVKLNELNDIFTSQDYLDIPEEFRNADARSAQGECIEYALNLINEGETDREIIAAKMRGDLEAACIIHQDTLVEDFYCELFYNKDSLFKFIDVCLAIHHNKFLYEIEETIRSIKYYLKLFNLINTSKNHNIYRQGFIQLIALFDTIVFDCYRQVFNLDFFNQLKYFKDGSIKYSELANFHDFEEFQASTVNSILKNCYLKDLLKISANQNKTLFVFNGIDYYAKTREMINRRNCHIHNNGIADDSYINGKDEAFNIFHQSIGNYLIIDKEYFDNAFKICCSFISNFIAYFSSTQ